MAARKPKFFNVKVEKLVHGGQGIGQLEDGRKAFVWGVLPGEQVRFRMLREKKDFVEGIVEDIENPSEFRKEPKDEHYLSTSPWQIMTESQESAYKQQIVEETFQRANVNYSGEIKFHEPNSYFNYRNKMEYSFYGDETGLHIALYNRGTHRKQIVAGSSIARSEIDEVANKICEVLDNKNVRAGDLKSLVARCNKQGEVVCALYVKDENFSKIREFGDICKGIQIIFSNPKSPVSVITKVLSKYGNTGLEDEVFWRKDRLRRFVVFSGECTRV